jgi:SulP family sulfate permease
LSFDRGGSSKGIVKDIYYFLLESINKINPRDNFNGLFSNWKPDIMAGITVAFIALPLALAFGVGSGLGASAGLWGAVAGGLFGSILGGSRIGVSGPTGPKMAQLAVIMASFTLADGSPDAIFAFTIILLSGLLLMGLSMLRISQLIYYTPYSVIAGFMCGIGVLVMILEIEPFLGVEGGKSVKEVIDTLPAAVTHINFESLFLSTSTLVLLFLYPKLSKRYSPLQKIPSTLVALFFFSILANVIGMNVQYIGEIPVGLPNIVLPDFTKYEFSQYLFPAISLAGLAVFDSLLTCLVNDNLTGDKHNSDREVFGQGVANVAAGLLGGLTTATATMRSVAIHQSGGKTRLASFVHGLVLLAIALFLGPIAAMIPIPVLAGILFKVGIDILDYRVLNIVHKLPFSDLIVFATVLLVTVFDDLLVAMGIGMALACFRFVQEISSIYKVQSSVPATEKLDDGILRITPSGPLFFGSVRSLSDELGKSDGSKKVEIDLSQVVFVDLSGAFALDDAISQLKQKGTEITIKPGNEVVQGTLSKLKLVERWGN